MKKKTRYPVFNKHFYLKSFIVSVVYNTNQPLGDLPYVETFE